MNSLARFEKIAIQSIAFSEEWNLHPFLSPDPTADLCASIHKLGILHPPIVKEETAGSYQLLCGRYRLRALQDSDSRADFTEALVLGVDSSSKQLVRYLLEDQQLTGTLSPMERAYFFRTSLKHMDIDVTKELFHAGTGERIHDHVIDKSLLLLKLEAELQLAVHFGKIHEKLALDLLRLDATDRLTLHKHFQELELGGGKQKRLVALCKDLAFRQGKTITTLLLEAPFSGVLDHPEMNRPQKAANLLALLQKSLFPQSSTAEVKFQKKIQEMDLPSSCTINHSQAFERDEVTVTLHFQKLADVEKRMAELKALMK